VYGSPRGALPGGSVTPESRSPQLVRRAKRSSSGRKRSTGKSSFRKQIPIGDSTIEDLVVHIENGTFHVRTVCESDQGELPITIELPEQVSPDQLICLVKNGILEVRENRKRSMVNMPNVLPRNSVACPSGSLNPQDLRRTMSYDPRRSSLHTVSQPPALRNCTRTPIVLEADDTTQLKLVMHIPDGLTMNDIFLKTVNTHLIVSAIQCGNNSPCQQDCPNVTQSKEVFQIFELPERVDPYSIEAHLSEKQKLIITVGLLPL